MTTMVMARVRTGRACAALPHRPHRLLHLGTCDLGVGTAGEPAPRHQEAVGVVAAIAVEPFGSGLNKLGRAWPPATPLCSNRIRTPWTATRIGRIIANTPISRQGGQCRATRTIRWPNCWSPTGWIWCRSPGSTDVGRLIARREPTPSAGVPRTRQQVRDGAARRRRRRRPLPNTAQVLLPTPAGAAPSTPGCWCPRQCATILVQPGLEMYSMLPPGDPARRDAVLVR